MQRLNLLYNRAKHAEKAITSQQLPLDGTLPVWLKNDGLHSVEASLTFAEIAEILEDLARFAEAAQDPPTMRAKLIAAYGLSDPPGSGGERLTGDNPAEALTARPRRPFSVST